MRALGASLIILALAGCQTSQDGPGSFVTTQGASVDFTDPSEPFSVRARGGAGARDYWCAAGAAVSQVMSPNTRIYLVSPITPGQPATFTVVPPAGGGAPNGLNIIGGASDNSLSVSQAKSQCPSNSSGNF
jgi:hypothetical protein